MKTREQLEATGNKILNSVRTELYLSMLFTAVLKSVNGITPGIFPLPHCFDASYAMRCKRCTFLSALLASGLETQRFDRNGTILTAPSSVAF